MLKGSHDDARLALAYVKQMKNKTTVARLLRGMSRENVNALLPTSEFIELCDILVIDWLKSKDNRRL
jgi:hypothetical protein